jgi:hypothetical protein
MKSALFVDFDNVYSGLKRLDPAVADRFAFNPWPGSAGLLSRSRRHRMPEPEQVGASSCDAATRTWRQRLCRALPVGSMRSAATLWLHQTNKGSARSELTP